MHWCAATNPAEPLRHNGTAPLRMRRVPPKASTLLSAGRARARIATPTDPVACEHQIAHKRTAATEAVTDTEALVCSDSRCSSP